MQSRVQSMLEAWANVAIGYVVALLSQLPTLAARHLVNVAQHHLSQRHPLPRVLRLCLTKLRFPRRSPRRSLTSCLECSGIALSMHIHLGALCGIYGYSSTP